MIAVNEAIILTDSGNENWGSISANMIQGADKNLGLKELPIRLYKGNQGFGLVHIANHLGDFTFSDISKEIENLFSKPNKIYARKCVIKEVDIHTSSEFLNKNHIHAGVVQW